MWFPDAPLIRVGLSQQGVSIARSTRLGRVDAASLERLVCEGAGSPGEPWRAAVERLGQWLAQQKGQRCKVRVVLSGRFVRWQLLPWRAELSGRSERAAHAGLRFREVFGKSAETWSIASAGLAPGRTAPVAALDKALEAALQQACQSSGAQLQQITPYFSSAFDRWSNSLKGSPAWFGTLEDDTLTLALLVGGEWVALQSQRLAGDWREPLNALMAQMAMASGQGDASAPLYLAGAMAQPPVQPGQAFHWLGPRAQDALALPGMRLACGC